MLILVVLGLLSLIMGIVFMMDEKSLKKLEESLNKPVIKSGQISKYSKPVGVLLMIFSGVLFFLAWSVKQ